MALRDRINKFRQVATATVATPATPNKKDRRSVATVAEIAVADPEKNKIDTNKDKEHGGSTIVDNELAEQSKSGSQGIATAIPATPATLELLNVRTVADVASVAVASAGKEESERKGLVPVVDGLRPCILCDGVLFNEGSRGGYFCVECQTLPEGASVSRVVRGIMPRKLQREYVYYEPSATTPRKDKRRPSPVALAWLLEHRQALDDAGWTRAELYRRNKSKQGIAWLKVWDMAFILAYLHTNGVIEFECSRGERDFFQRARPAAMLATSATSGAQSVNPNLRRANNESKL